MFFKSGLLFLALLCLSTANPYEHEPTAAEEQTVESLHTEITQVQEVTEEKHTVELNIEDINGEEHELTAEEIEALETLNKALDDFFKGIWESCKTAMEQVTQMFAWLLAEEDDDNAKKYSETHDEEVAKSKADEHDLEATRTHGVLNPKFNILQNHQAHSKENEIDAELPMDFGDLEYVLPIRAQNIPVERPILIN